MGIGDSKALDRLEVYYDGCHVGTIAPYQRYLTAFEYTEEWVRSGFSISPFSLPLETGVKIARVDPFEGMFGVFANSLPASEAFHIDVFQRVRAQSGRPLQ